MSQSLHGSQIGSDKPGVVVAALFTGHDDAGISNCAIDTAVEHGVKLLALYVVDSAVADAVFDKLTDLVFIGERPSMQLSQAILEEYELRAQDRLREVVEAAAERSVECCTRLEKGSLVEILTRTASEIPVTEIVLAEPRRSLFQQIFSHSVAEDLRRMGLPIRVVKAVH